MASRNRTHITTEMGSLMNPNKLTPKNLTKQEFGRRLYQLMLTKNWRQSELARKANIQRNAISTYVLGKALPTPVNLKKLAHVFGMKSEELLPNSAQHAMETDDPMVSMQVSPGQPGKAWLRVNQMVDTALAVQILGLIQAKNDNKPAERK